MVAAGSASSAYRKNALRGQAGTGGQRMACALRGHGSAPGGRLHARRDGQRLAAPLAPGFSRPAARLPPARLAPEPGEGLGQQVPLQAQPRLQGGRAQQRRRRLKWRLLRRAAAHPVE